VTATGSREAARIQLSRAKGWRLPPGAVMAARPSKWGNPFRIGEAVARERRRHAARSGSGSRHHGGPERKTIMTDLTVARELRAAAEQARADTSLPPAVGAALAGLLDAEALDYEDYDAVTQAFRAGDVAGDLDPAVALARAYLAARPPGVPEPAGPGYAVLQVTVPARAVPCGSCGGLGVTGDRFEMRGDHGPILVCDVICKACGGCGNGGDHQDCAADMHAWPGDPDDGYADELAALDDECDGRDRCPSCVTGRGWNAVQGYTTHAPTIEGGATAEDVTLRVPCGCAEARLITGADPAALASVIRLGAEDQQR
jgi:hypothetical protein